MRIIILGGSGMLGHRLWLTLQQQHDTWVTTRGSQDHFPDIPEFTREKIISNVDALIFDEVVRALSTVKPDVVINCIGLIKQTPLAKDPLSAIRVNAMLPHQLALICGSASIRLSHISTDCVFSGRRGNYTEEDESDAVDLYGRTKYLGEVSYPNTVTLRTSIIGRELKSKLGLIEWFLAQSGEINGYRQAIYSGLTTDELGRVILEHVLQKKDITGVYHISSEPISKFDLLKLVKQAFDHNVTINPYDGYVIDRSLDSTRFRETTGYQSPTWEEMICEMSERSALYGDG
jgi:dTDP-4-dehydrorhamnose reductase